MSSTNPCSTIATVCAATPLSTNSDRSCTISASSEAISNGVAQRLRMIRPTQPAVPPQTAIAVAATDLAGRAACIACCAAVSFATSSGSSITSAR